MSESTPGNMTDEQPQHDDRAEAISQERRAELEARIGEVRDQLGELASERDAVLAGLEDVRAELGDEAADAVLAEAGFADDRAGESLRAKLAAAEEERLRLLADMQNVRRRAAQNEQAARQQGARDAVQSLLGVLDHFDLTLGHVDPEQATAQSVLEGVQMIRAEMVRVLGTLGVEVINPHTGEAFDPTRHTAIMQQPAPEAEPNTVLHVARAGYAISGQIIRPAEVVVAAPPQVDESDPGAERAPE